MPAQGGSFGSGRWISPDIHVSNPETSNLELAYGHSLSFLNYFKMKRIIFSVCLFSSLLLHAQEQKDSAELEPVEVRATRANATAPFAKTNISKKEIARQNLGQDLPFLLN